jgi:hypothetical protein
MHNSDGKTKMDKNAVTFAVLILLFIFSTGYGQKTGLKGRVVGEDNKPIQNAQVKLISAVKSQTTDSAGNFFFEMKTSIRILPAGPVLTAISFHNGILSFNVSENQQEVHIEVFDNKGQRVNKVIHEGIGKGTYSIEILQNILPAAIYFVKLQIGNRSCVFNVINLKNRACSLPGKEPYIGSSLLKRSAGGSKAIDTLGVSKDNYQAAQITINSYVTDLPDIVLKSKELPPIVNGKSARTTRYWDCCKPACGWNSNMRMCDITGKDINDKNAKSGCEGGPAFQCLDYAPIEINNKISYAWAAFNNSGTQCGDCFQLALQGALNGKQLIVQVINIGNGGNDAFDLLIPGGGVGALNGCPRQWNNAPLGTQYGGFRSTCGNNKDCILGMCQKAFGEKADLMRGCNWYLNWFQMADNPGVSYMKVSCPKEIKDISRIGN